MPNLMASFLIGPTSEGKHNLPRKPCSVDIEWLPEEYIMVEKSTVPAEFPIE
jgi:hypothetical protein